jgi:5-methylcytosine-specific restriction enzyme B
VQPTIWVFLQEHTPANVATVNTRGRRAPFIFSKSDDGRWQLIPGWEQEDSESEELVAILKAGKSARHGPIHRYRVVTFHPSFSYEDFVRGIRPVETDSEGTTQFRLVDGVFKQICDEARANRTKRYALFIDEINRANIATVFGELISLIERDKRAVFDDNDDLVRGMAVQLPGSDEIDGVIEPPFGVPHNLDIYGTMNTADRSIALLDVALRRRFEFQEMEPNYELLDRRVGEVHLGSLLRRVNDRLEFLLDRDHRIGHAYLMIVNEMDDLRRVFRAQIIPLLQEYFFDDLARVRTVLATEAGTPPFIVRSLLRHENLFAGPRPDGVPEERYRYTVTPEVSWTEASFRGIYAEGKQDSEISESL